MVFFPWRAFSDISHENISNSVIANRQQNERDSFWIISISNSIFVTNQNSNCELRLKLMLYVLLTVCRIALQCWVTWTFRNTNFRHDLMYRIFRTKFLKIRIPHQLIFIKYEFASQTSEQIFPLKTKLIIMLTKKVKQNDQSQLI